jgi:YD repeat-containing protein
LDNDDEGRNYIAKVRLSRMGLDEKTALYGGSMVCKTCGRDNYDWAEKCSKCGSILAKKGIKIKKTEKSTENQNDAGSTPNAKNKNKKTNSIALANKGLKISAGIFAVGALIFFLIMPFFLAISFGLNLRVYFILYSIAMLVFICVALNYIPNSVSKNANSSLIIASSILFFFSSIFYWDYGPSIINYRSRYSIISDFNKPEKRLASIQKLRSMSEDISKKQTDLFPVLHEALRDDNEILHGEALKIILNIGDSTAIFENQIINVLKDKSIENVTLAVELLKKFKTPGAILALKIKDSRSYAKYNTHTAKGELELHGNVKSVIEKINGSFCRKIDFDKQGNILNQYLYHVSDCSVLKNDSVVNHPFAMQNRIYNGALRLIAIFSRDSTGNLDDSLEFYNYCLSFTPASVDVFYDSKGNKIGEAFYNKNYLRIYTIKYTCNDRGSPIKEEHINGYSLEFNNYISEETINRTYNEKGNEISSELITSDGRKYACHYDANGNIIKSEIIKSGDKSPFVRSTIKYDRYGRKIKVESYGLQGQYAAMQNQTGKYTYDDYGNIVRETNFHRGNSIPFFRNPLSEELLNIIFSVLGQGQSPDRTELKYTYEYDANNNWIHKSTSKGNPQERVISYSTETTQSE